jgi:hypothetical protein
MTTPDIFGVDLAGIVGDALGPLVFDQTLIVVTSSRDPLDSTKTIKVETFHPCKGFIDVFSDRVIDGTNIKYFDRNIAILGATLPQSVVPNSGDKIIAEGKTFTITDGGVRRDPAGAIYECHSR